MDLDIGLQSLRNDRAEFTALHGSDLTARVIGCPEWDLAALVGHLGSVHRFAMRSMDRSTNGEFTKPKLPADPVPENELLWDWLESGFVSLIATFEERDLSEPCWSWIGPATVGWWLRRQVHETAVHRWDAQTAAGVVPVIDGSRAADGVDEWLLLKGGHGWTPPAELRGTIHLHATDGDGEWLIELDESLTWKIGHHKGDVALRGARSDLELLLWGRVGLDNVEVLGDRDLAARFLAAL